MATQIKIFIIVLLVALTPELSFAQGDSASAEDMAKVRRNSKNVKKKAKKKDSGRDAVVKQDGAAVYEVANFDSPVLEYMDQGKKIKISKKIYPGVGGLGAFYRVKVKSGFGYIADVDVQVEKSGGSNDSRNDNPPVNNKQDIEDGVSDPSQLQDSMMNDEPNEPQGADSIYMSKWLGLTYASFNYRETIANQVRSGATPMFGFEYAGPTSFMGGFPLDLEFLVTTSPPPFYDNFTNSASGYMLIGSGMAMMPLYESRSAMVFYGLGLVSKYVSWDVALTGQEGKPNLDSQILTLGAAAEAGFVYKFGKTILFRAEGKYFYEEEKYFGYSVGLQIKR